MVIKNFWSEKKFGRKKKFSSETKKFDWKQFWVGKKMLVSNFFWSKKILGLEFFNETKDFGQNKTFWSEKNVGRKKSLVDKKI